MEIIVKKFEPHYNVALGKVVTSQRQYDEEVKRGGYIPYEECEQRAERNRERHQWKGVSDEAVEWTKGVVAKADKKGNVRLSGREIEALKTAGCALDRRLPEHYRTDTGGFSNT